MTHQTNKQFNTYKEGLDMEALREYCMGFTFDGEPLWQ
jgi:hypothetical protein